MRPFIIGAIALFVWFGLCIWADTPLLPAVGAALAIGFFTTICNLED